MLQDGVAPTPDRWPPVDVVVPIYNEAATIAGKLQNLADLDYPRDRLRLLVVDGGSSDGTIQILSTFVKNNPRLDLDLVLTRLANKTAQLNRALHHTTAPWIMVTDADARMPADTLLRLVDAAQGADGISVVGTLVTPQHPHPLDGWHWRLSNRVRQFERRFGTTGLVVAPCYFFRRLLLDEFPADTVADDVHIACKAAVAGTSVALVDVEVRELRSPETGVAWYRHKVRRTLGYLREVRRFVPLSGRMSHPMREIFLWRAAALTLGPIVGTALVVAVPWLAGIGGTLLLVLLGAAAVAAIAAPEARRGEGSLEVVYALAVPISILLVTATALVLYPFVRQTASYSKTTLQARS